MKMLLLSLLSLLIIGCADDPDSIWAEEFSCKALPVGLENLQVGDDIESTELSTLFSSIEPSVYQSGSYCSKDYDFQQYNKNDGGWCYYTQVDVDCDTKLVTSIYDGSN